MTTRLPPTPPEWVATQRQDNSQEVAWAHARANASGHRVNYRAATDFHVSEIPSGDFIDATVETRYVDPEQLAPTVHPWDVSPFAFSPTETVARRARVQLAEDQYQMRIAARRAQADRVQAQGLPPESNELVALRERAQQMANERNERRMFVYQGNTYTVDPETNHLSEHVSPRRQQASACNNPVDYYEPGTQRTVRVYPMASPQLTSEADDRLLAELTGSLTYSQPEMEMVQNQINAKYFNKWDAIHRDMFVKKQRTLKVGHLVEVHNTSSGWGSSRTRNHYIGVVTSIGTNRSAGVLPLTGAVMQHWLTEADKPYAIAALGGAAQQCPTPGMGPLVYVGVFFKSTSPILVSRRHIQIINPDELHPSWEAVANDWRLYRRQFLNAGRENVIIRLSRLAAATYNADWRNIRTAPAAHSFFRVKTEYKAGGKNAKATLKRVRRGELVLATLTLDYAQERHFASNGRTHGYFARVLDILNRNRPSRWIVAACSHYAEEHTTQRAYNSRGYSGTACPHCLATVYNQSVLNADGEAVNVSQDYLDQNNVHTWDDGTRRTTAMPSMIQSYHSSRGKFIKLGLLDGSTYNGVCVGMELEMESTVSNSDTIEKRAREVNNTLAATMVKLGMPSSHRYGFFERDGSVSDGFELVTNYGPPETHRAVIMGAFGTGQGTRLPFAGKLRAHDAVASCGIHVHLTKPKTLLHAARMFQFYNAANMRPLIECVARRYGGNFAKVRGVVPRDTVTKAVEIAQYRKRYGISLSTALNQLHGEDRYSAVNFNNEHTVEVRVFRGSMLPTTILACMELAYMSWFFCRDYDAAHITVTEFMQYIQRAENLKESGYLRAYLIAKGVMAPPVVKRGTKHDIVVEATEGQE